MCPGISTSAIKTPAVGSGVMELPGGVAPFLALGLSVLCGCIGASIASFHSFSRTAGFLLGAIFGPIGVLVVLVCSARWGDPFKGTKTEEPFGLSEQVFD